MIGKMRAVAALSLILAGAAGAAPPYPAYSLSQLDAAVRAACHEIDGVSLDGSIFFQSGASCQSAATAAMVNFSPLPPTPTTLDIRSTSAPSLNASYAFDAATQSKILAVSLYISVNGKFPAGQTVFPWPDATGTMHAFASTAQFQALASALADYATALALGQSPPTPVTIP